MKLITLTTTCALFIAIGTASSSWGWGNCSHLKPGTPGFSQCHANVAAQQKKDTRPAWVRVLNRSTSHKWFR